MIFCFNLSEVAGCSTHFSSMEFLEQILQPRGHRSGTTGPDLCHREIIPGGIAIDIPFMMFNIMRHLHDVTLWTSFFHWWDWQKINEHHHYVTAWSCHVVTILPLPETFGGFPRFLADPVVFIDVGVQGVPIQGYPRIGQCYWKGAPLKIARPRRIAIDR